MPVNFTVGLDRVSRAFGIVTAKSSQILRAIFGKGYFVYILQSKKDSSFILAIE